MKHEKLYLAVGIILTIGFFAATIYYRSGVFE